MPQRSNASSLLQVRVSTLVSTILILTALIVFFVFYGKYNYSHIPKEIFQSALYKRRNPLLVLKRNKPNCTYDDVLQRTKSLHNWEVPTKFDDFSVNGLVNGTYSPETCNPLFSVAILVTYRNRQSQLDVFLPYLHNFLRKQQIHYKIYLIEQQDEKPWNKGLLYNIGAKYAMKDKFPCLILHDVDLLPLDESNLYVCLNEPRHMSASIDKFRYVLPYDGLVGGVLAIPTSQFLAINGFSNRFLNWGGEDDDLSKRITENGLQILRYPREMSRYKMLLHLPTVRNQERFRTMHENILLIGLDGMNNAHYDDIHVKVHRLFTLIGVKT